MTSAPEQERFADHNLDFLFALLRQKRIATHSQEWYSERSIRLTASDMPTVLGENPYRTVEQLYKQKTGQLQSLFDPDNQAIQWGHTYEPKAAFFYECITGNKLLAEDIGLVIHPHYPQFGASPDRVVIHLVNGKRILVEIKCPYSRTIKGLCYPSYYYSQVQTQLWVMDFDECHFVQFKPSLNMFMKGQFSISVIKRDEDWIKTKVPRLIRFWKRVEDHFKRNGHPIMYKTTAAAVDEKHSPDHNHDSFANTPVQSAIVLEKQTVQPETKFTITDGKRNGEKVMHVLSRCAKSGAMMMYKYNVDIEEGVAYLNDVDLTETTASAVSPTTSESSTGIAAPLSQSVSESTS